MTSVGSFRYCILSVFVIVGSGLGKDLSETPAGCVEIGCPDRDGPDTRINCTVVDEEYGSIGLARIPFASETDATTGNLNGLSWVQGVQDANVDSETRNFTKAYYLGTPQDVDVTSLRGCALIFQETDAEFPGDNQEEARGDCSDALPQECIDALVGRAKRAGSCQELQTTFENDTEYACDGYINQRQRQRISVFDLSELNPISEADNATSNCWPILPKTDGLAFVDAYTQQGDYYGDTAIDILFSVNPILTVFFDEDGANPANEESNAQLTCMRTYAMSQAAQDNFTPNSGHRLGHTEWSAAIMVVWFLFHFN